jgi:hypothetical protein
MKHKQDAIDLATEILKSHISNGCTQKIAIECAITTLKMINKVTFARPISVYQRALNYLCEDTEKYTIEQIEKGEYTKLIAVSDGFIKVYEYKEDLYKILENNNKEKFIVTEIGNNYNSNMNYYAENNLVVSVDSVIEYQIDLSGGKRYDAVVGLTNRKGHEGKFGFMQDGNDLFGNGYKFKTKQDALEAIVSNIKSAINRNEKPMPVLKIDGKVVQAFIKVL